MGHDITLFGTGSNRSARVAWTLAELGITAEIISYEGMIGGPELQRLHPLGKIPAAYINGSPLFESTAICQYLCAITEGQTLLAREGSIQRALHDQWTSFSQSEIENYLWNNFQLRRSFTESEHFSAALRFNNGAITRGLVVMEQHLMDREFILGDSFSLADILVGWTVNWARKSDFLIDTPNLDRYLQALFQRSNIKLVW